MYLPAGKRKTKGTVVHEQLGVKWISGYDQNICSGCHMQNMVRSTAILSFVYKDGVIVGANTHSGSEYEFIGDVKFKGDNDDSDD